MYISVYNAFRQFLAIMTVRIFMCVCICTQLNNTIQERKLKNFILWNMLETNHQKNFYTYNHSQ